MAVALLVDGELVYLCELDRGAAILDVGDPKDIAEIGRLSNTAQARDIAYVCCNANGLKLFDVNNPSAPACMERFRGVPEFCWRLAGEACEED